MYIRLDVSVGETVSLTCNTSTDIMWTYDTDVGLVDYIYWNRRVHKDKPRLSVNSTAANNVHSLVVADVHLSDTGLYDCYTNSGLRTVGYQLTVNSTYYLSSCIIVRLGIINNYLEFCNVPYVLIFLPYFSNMC